MADLQGATCTFQTEPILQAPVAAPLYLRDLFALALTALDRWRKRITYHFTTIRRQIKCSAVSMSTVLHSSPIGVHNSN